MKKPNIVTWVNYLTGVKEYLTRFLFKNWYGIPTKENGRHKVDRLRNMVRQLEEDGLVGMYVGVNGYRNSADYKFEIFLKIGYWSQSDSWL